MDNPIPTFGEWMFDAKPFRDAHPQLSHRMAAEIGYNAARKYGEKLAPLVEAAKRVVSDATPAEDFTVEVHVDEVSDLRAALANLSPQTKDTEGK